MLFFSCEYWGLEVSFCLFFLCRCTVALWIVLISSSVQADLRGGTSPSGSLMNVHIHDRRERAPFFFFLSPLPSALACKMSVTHNNTVCINLIIQSFCYTNVWTGFTADQHIQSDDRILFVELHSFSPLFFGKICLFFLNDYYYYWSDNQWQ